MYSKTACIHCIDSTSVNDSGVKGGLDFGFVRQNVLFINSLTVREHMNFVANCRLSNIPSAARANRISGLIKEFRLTKCQHVRIQFLSGGEQKRLAFASAYIHSPGTDTGQLKYCAGLQIVLQVNVLFFQVC